MNPYLSAVNQKLFFCNLLLKQGVGGEPEKLSSVQLEQVLCQSALYQLEAAYGYYLQEIAATYQFKSPETTLDGTTLTVKPAANAPSVPTISPPVIQDNLAAPLEESATAITADIKNESSMLLWLLVISNIVLFVALVTLFVLWRKSKSAQSSSLLQTTKSEQKESELFKQLKKAANNQDYQGFREALLAWASSHWQQTFVTLDQVATLTKHSPTNSPSLKLQLQALDSALYGSGDTVEIDLPGLVDELKQLKSQSDQKNQGKENHLKPLYG